MRIGLLGTGPWARAAYAPALAGHTGLEFAGVWGRRPEAATELAEQYDVAAYADVDALLADVDAVAVALPPSVQPELAVRAARAGRHLLLDKPLALSVAGAREVAEAAERAGVASVVFFTARFQKEPEAWIDEQAAEAGWFTARDQWLGAVFTTDSPFAASPWRREKGALWDVGPHALSVLLPVSGTYARSWRRCTARGHRAPRARPCHGCVEHPDAEPDGAARRSRCRCGAAGGGGGVGHAGQLRGCGPRAVAGRGRAGDGRAHGTSARL